MFTGIIQCVGKVRIISPQSSGIRLAIEPVGWNHQPSSGDSISVNGCCLTVSPSEQPLPPGFASSWLWFDVVPQTLQVTTLGGLNVCHDSSDRGRAAVDAVNLEHAVTTSTLFGGHIVQGHIDGVGVVTRVSTNDGEWRVRIEPPSELMEYMVNRGSVAVDGVSLTLATVTENWFEVALIPTTLKMTTLGSLQPGSRVNLETDCIARTVVSWLKKTQGASAR